MLPVRAVSVSQLDDLLEACADFSQGSGQQPSYTVLASGRKMWNESPPQLPASPSSLGPSSPLTQRETPPQQLGTEEEERARLMKGEEVARGDLFRQFWSGPSPSKKRESPWFDERLPDRKLRRAFREVCQSAIDDADSRLKGRGAGPDARGVAHQYIQAVLNQVDNLPRLSLEKAGEFNLAAEDRFNATKNLDARKMLAACCLECVLQKMEERFPKEVERGVLETWVVDQIAELMQDKGCAYLERGVRASLRAHHQQVLAQGFGASPLTASLAGGRSGVEPWIQEGLSGCMQQLPVAIPFRIPLSRSTRQEAEDSARVLQTKAYPRIQGIIRRFRAEVIDLAREEFISAFHRHKRQFPLAGDGERLRAVKDQKPLFTDLLIWIGDHPEQCREFALALYT